MGFIPFSAYFSFICTVPTYARYSKFWRQLVNTVPTIVEYDFFNGKNKKYIPRHRPYTYTPHHHHTPAAAGESIFFILKSARIPYSLSRPTKPTLPSAAADLPASSLASPSLLPLPPVSAAHLLAGVDTSVM